MTGAAGGVWRPVGPLLACSRTHPPGGGHVDEAARRLSHSELAVAERLRAEGHQVQSLPDWTGRGPVADLRVCGTLLEVKSWVPRGERSAPPGPRSVFNKLASAQRQAPNVVLNGYGSGLTESVARAGVAEFAARYRWGRIDTVRVLGDGFDLSWSRSLRIGREASSGAQTQPPRSQRGWGIEGVGR